MMPLFSSNELLLAVAVHDYRILRHCLRITQLQEADALIDTKQERISLPSSLITWQSIKFSTVRMHD